MGQMDFVFFLEWGREVMVSVDFGLTMKTKYI